jgi:hypothetical protein
MLHVRSRDPDGVNSIAQSIFTFVTHGQVTVVGPVIRLTATRFYTQEA